MKKKRTAAILVVSYGCSSRRMREKTLDRIEADIKEAYPAYAVFHAWTSARLRQKCSEQEGIKIPGVKDAMEELRKQGFCQVAVVPTHVLEGLEYQRMKEEILAFESLFSKILIGAPLLAAIEDKKKTARILAGELSPGAGEALVLMGHGTKSMQNAAYAELDEIFRKLGYENVFVGTVEGIPGFLSVLNRVSRCRPERIRLAPLTVTVGKHAAEELSSGKNSSWKSRFEAAGFPVTGIRKGLGEYEGIRRIFAEHAGDLVNMLESTGSWT